MTTEPSSNNSKPFVPKQIFLAHEFFLKGVYFDHGHQFDKARENYIRSSKIFTYLTKNHPDMTLFDLWVEQAQLAIDRVKKLNAPDFKPINQPARDDKEEQELMQRVLKTRLVPNKNLSWNDIIGLDNVVEQLYDTVFLPLKYPELLRGNITTPRTMLLFGPPGCGKTQLIRVLTAEANIHVYGVSAANLLSKWFGESQKMIRAHYQAAWANAPSIIFIDEFDGLFGGPSTSSKSDSDSSSTMVQIQKELPMNASSLEQTLIRLTVGAIIGFFFIIRRYSQNLEDISRSMHIDLQKSYFLQGLLFSTMVFAYLSSIALETPAGEAALLIQIHPIFTLILGWGLLGDSISKPKIGAVILAFIGVGLITQPWESESFLSSLVGDFLAALNGFFYAFYLLVARGTAKSREGIPSFLSTSWILVYGLLTGIPLLFVFSSLPIPDEIGAFRIEMIIQLEIIVLGALLAFFGGIISYGLITLSNKYDIESSSQSILVLGEPLAAIVLGAWILLEPITIWYLTGGAILLIAIIITIITSTRDLNKV
jgi:SpoVK/Ycf46/Vps4 family AAA+-type ATPase